MNMKILVLGVTGMLGSTVFKFLSETHDVWGTLRNSSGKRFFSKGLQEKIISNVDVLNNDELTSLLLKVRPDVIINCIGLIKQLPSAKDPLVALPINTLFPHRLARLSELQGSRLVHISTDCVFSGNKGMYLENDESDALDLYGKSKYLGELNEYSHCVTLRTSIIGHELDSNFSLVDWFLNQNKPCVKGFNKAIFSGLPTIELARVIRDYVLPNSYLKGLYHVSANPINKYYLLSLISKKYDKLVDIVPDTTVVMNRSLDSTLFREKVGYFPSQWEDLISFMYETR